MNTIISVNDLEKCYGARKAVAGISFDIYDGEIIGLLGPNGAGKSTTINMLATLLEPDRGRISIVGASPQENRNMVKRNMGIVPQDLAIYEELSAEKNVRFFGSLHGLRGKKLADYVQDALEVVSLDDRKDEKPKGFSGGMKRRLNIACGIVHKPKVIIMDEPTVGIDPQSRNHILQSILKLRDQGATIIYSTHYMEEVEAIADRILIMNEGELIAEGTKETLTETVGDQIIYSFELEQADSSVQQDLRRIDGVLDVFMDKTSVQVVATQSSNNLNTIFSALLESGCALNNMNIKKSSLETVFLELTGRALRD